MGTDEPRITGHPATRVSFLFAMDERAGRRSVMIHLLREARRSHMAGATVFKARNGFGAAGRSHRDHLVAEDAPAALVIIDVPDRIARFLEAVDPVLEGVTVVLEEVEVMDAAVTDH